MKKDMSSIVIIAKRLLFFSLPILLFLFVFYRLILDVNIELLWLRLLTIMIIVEVTNLRNYKHNSVEEPVESVGYLEDKRK